VFVKTPDIEKHPCPENTVQIFSWNLSL